MPSRHEDIPNNVRRLFTEIVRYCLGNRREGFKQEAFDPLTLVMSPNTGPFNPSALLASLSICVQSQHGGGRTQLVDGDKLYSHFGPFGARDFCVEIIVDNTVIWFVAMKVFWSEGHTLGNVEFHRVHRRLS